MSVVVCPACHAEMSLDVALASEEARQAVARLLAHSLPLGALTMRYLALFRPEKRRMSIDKLCRLVEELQPDITRGAITRKGRDWHAPIDTWRAGMELVLAKHAKGTLTLPLTSHGLLHEVICGLAEKGEAAAEARREEERRQRRNSGARDAGPRDLSEMATAAAESAASGAPVLSTFTQPPTYGGPSKAALAIRAENEARKRARTEGAVDTPPTEPATGATA